jgi:hypothetical protein
VGRHLPGERLHAGALRAVADHQEELAVSRAVLPLGIGEIRRPRVEIRTHRAIAFARVAVTAGALLVVEGFAGGERGRIGLDRVRHLRGGWMAVRSAGGMGAGLRWMLVCGLREER